jgi:uncharacterized surface protein with fasciclin (FAS1) repeats
MTKMLKPMTSSLAIAALAIVFATASTHASYAGPAQQGAPASAQAPPAPSLQNEPAPATGAQATPRTTGTILEVASQAGQFSTLLAALTAAGLTETLSGTGPFTVFAPTDAAFAKLPAGTVENLLMPENKEKLAAILSYHVVPGRVASSDLANVTSTPATVQGGRLSVDTSSGVKIGGATVVGPDVAATNGTIHVIDTVLLPPARAQ